MIAVLCIGFYFMIRRCLDNRIGSRFSGALNNSHGNVLHEYWSHLLCLVGVREGACTSAQMGQPQHCNIRQGIILPDFKYLLLKVCHCIVIGQFCGDAIWRSTLPADHVYYTSDPCYLFSKTNDGSVYWNPRVYVERCAEKRSIRGITSYKNHGPIVQWTTAMKCECSMKEKPSRVWSVEKGRLHMQASFALIMMNPTLVNGLAGVEGPSLFSVAMDSAIVISMAVTIAVLATNAIGMRVGKRKDKFQRFGRYIAVILPSVGLFPFLCLPALIAKAILSNKSLELVRHGLVGCYVNQIDADPLLFQAKVECLVRLVIAIIFLIILIHASISIDHNPGSINGTKIFIWGLVILVVLREALLFINEVNLSYEWNIWIILLVISMLMIERGIIDCDHRLTRTCFVKGSITHRAISIIYYVGTGATMTYQVLTAESFECGFDNFHGLQTFLDSTKCRVSQCNWSFEGQITSWVLSWLPLVAWTIARILWTTWREWPSQRRLRNRRSATMEFMGLASILAGNVEKVSPTSILLDIDADRETEWLCQYQWHLVAMC